MEVIFREGNAPELSLAIMGEACAKTDWQCSYFMATRRQPKWLRRDWLLGEWGIPLDSAAGRKQFGLQMEARRKAKAAVGSYPLPRGWCLGSEGFARNSASRSPTCFANTFSGG